MQVVRSLQDVPAAARGGVLTIGNFDGVHKGHQAVIATVRAKAADLRAPSGAMLFDPHPRAYFQPHVPLFTLTAMAERLELLAATGLDFAAVLPFDAKMAGLSAPDFIREVLVDGLAVRHLVVGYDFCFGKGRLGDVAMLEAEGRASGFGLSVQAPERDGAAAFSSSRVRQALREGNIGEASRQLGRFWRLSGTVISGAGRGTGLGYPTANIAVPPGTGLAHGIYAAWVWAEGTRHAAVGYLGSRPVFGDGSAGFETFLLDYDGNLYDKHIEIDLVAFIRGDRNFASPAELTQQMGRDVIQARHLLR